MDSVTQQVNTLYKDHFGKMVAALLYSSRDIDPESAEDIVQDSFSAALTVWKQQGIPANPAGWIFKVCKHKALNKIKKDKRLEPLSEHTILDPIDTRFSESILEDDQLRVLFACAHPDLSPKTQVVITLKYVANLKVEAIANILGMTIDGIDKLLLRARQRIKDEKILLEQPHDSALTARISSVHKILYLIFNEGYKSSWGKEILREELCEEALLTTRALIASPFGNKDTYALYSLMLFNSARFESRFGADGELLDLENQNRSHWNRELITLANDFFCRSQCSDVSTYHLEASIAYIHCNAPRFHDTNWTMITKLYAQLSLNNPNPFVQLNYAIALYHANFKDTAFDILNELRSHSFFNQYYLLNSALGKFYLLEGNVEQAKYFLARALEQTSFEKEKTFIRKMIKGIHERFAHTAADVQSMGSTGP